MTEPLADASGLIQRAYELLVEARATRERLQAMAPTDTSNEAERALYLGMVATLERDLVKTLEHVLSELKGAAGGAEAEAWLRRQMRSLEG